jgi:hypothetical protein
MIEELKSLIQVVNGLPQLAIWVAVGFWAYKVIIIGSVYGVIRLAINKSYAAYTRPSKEDINVTIDGIIYYEQKKRLIGILKRVVPDKYDTGESLDWLEDAINAKIEKDGLPKKQKHL